NNRDGSEQEEENFHISSEPSATRGSKRENADRGRDNNIQQGDRKKTLPPEIHQLVVTKPRQRGAQPDVQKKKEEHLCEEIQWAKPWDLLYKGSIPSSQEQHGRNHRHRKHVGVLSEEKHGELHRAVFRVESGTQLRLSLRQIEGHPVRFGNGANQVNKKSDRLKPEEVPAHSPCTRLVVYDLHQIQRTCLHHRTDHRERKTQFIAHHLSG